ncbi:MAG TPA: hypothetical protein VEI52_27330 [Terriglobales bacterium]|nr:hypothetical protein [Terriglobales bacterium]
MGFRKSDFASLLRSAVMVPITLGFDPRRYLKIAALLTAICLGAPLYAQEIAQSGGATLAPVESVPDLQAAPLAGTREKWTNFVHETASPLTFGGGAFNATFSQLTNTDPQYGANSVAYAERFAASMADIASQNFFGDFVVASVFHEDPRYFRKGPGAGFWSRVGYTLSRALVIRKDSGGNTFNFDNVLGSAFSTGFSNLYYPPASRTGKAMLMHFGIDVADNGFVNLAPEFWPDFRDKVLRRHH